MTKFRSALVTGGNGLVGSALVELLLRSQVEVTCLVRSKQRLAASLGDSHHAAGKETPSDLPAGIRAIELPSFHRANLEAALANVSADVVFHLASYGVRPQDRDPQQLTDGNIALTADLIELTAKWPLRRFVHAASCAEYGMIDSAEPVAESHPLRPVSAYGVAKATSYFLGRALAARQNVPFVALRLFGVFGPREHPERLIPYLISKLQRDEPVDLTPGEQVRDFLYSEDAAQTFWEAAGADLEHGEAYNVCSGRGTSVRQFGEIVADALGKPRELLRWGARPYRDDEPRRLVGDPRRFLAASSWRPRIPPAEGVQRMIEMAQRRKTAEVENAV